MLNFFNCRFVFKFDEVNRRINVLIALLLPSQKESVIDINWNRLQVILILLQNTCFNDGDVNLVQFLQEIASEQQFEVTYVDIEEKSISGKLISDI